MTESEFRRLDFVLRETLVTASGETDVFRPEPVRGISPQRLDGIEIRIDLTPHPASDRGSLLSFDTMSVMHGTSRLRLCSGNGRSMDAEMIEVVAWEMIEDEESVTGYMEGRNPHRLPDGKLAPAGHVVRHGETDDEPEPAQSGDAAEMAGP